MIIIECPHCSVRISPTGEGHCPACRKTIPSASERSLSENLRAEATTLPLPPDATGPHSPKGEDADEALTTCEYVVFLGVGESPLEPDPGISVAITPKDLAVASSSDNLSPRPILCRGLFRAIWFCFGLLILQAVTIGFANGFMEAEGGLPAAGLFAISGLTVLFVAYRTLEKRHGNDLNRVVAWRRPALYHVVVGLLLVPPMLVCVASLSNSVWNSLGMHLSAAIDWSYFEQRYIELALEPWWVVVLVGCLLPAVAEESFFRAILGRGLISAYGVGVGVFLTSAFFGMFHVQPAHVFSTFLLGLGLHFAYLTTKSLIVPILMHAANNLLAFSVLRLSAMERLMPTQGSEVEYIPASLGLSSLGALATLLILLWKTRVYWILDNGRPWTPGFVSAEAPPADVSATPRLSAVGGLAIGFAALAFAGFCISTSSTAVAWIALTHANRAMIEADAGNDRMAKREIDEAFKLNADLAWVQASAAWVYVNSGKDDRALDYAKAAIDLDPELGFPYAIRGWVNYHRGNWRGALTDCNEAIRVDPKSSLAYATRAAIRMDLEKYSDAVKDATAALLQDPELPLALAVRGGCYGEMRDWGSSLKDLDRAVNLAPDYTFALSCRAKTHYGMEKYSEAVADATAALETSSTDVEAYFYRGLAYQAQDQNARALTDFCRSLEIDDTRADIRRVRGELYLKMREPEKALADFDFLKTRFPADDEVTQLLTSAVRLLEEREPAVRIPSQTVEKLTGIEANELCNSDHGELKPAAPLPPSRRHESPQEGVENIWRWGQIFPTSHTGVIICLTYSPDGAWILSASMDKSVVLWNARTGRESHRLIGHQDKVWRVAFSPDSALVATGSEDGTVRIWNVQSGKLAHVLRHSEDSTISGVAFSPDGRRLASTSWDKTLRIWDFATETELDRSSHEVVLKNVVFSPDDRYLVCSGRDNRIHIFSSKDIRNAKRLEGHQSLISRIFIMPDHRRVASTSYDGTIRFWDMERGVESQCLTGHRGLIQGAFLISDERRVLSIGVDRSVWIWNLETQSQVTPAARLTSVPGLTTLSPDGKRLVFAEGGFWADTARKVMRDGQPIRLRIAELADAVQHTETGEVPLAEQPPMPQ